MLSYDLALAPRKKSQNLVFLRLHFRTPLQKSTGADPDLACYFDADPDPTIHFDPNQDPTLHFDPDPDPTFHFDADPDPSYQIKAQNLGEVLK